MTLMTVHCVNDVVVMDVCDRCLWIDDVSFFFFLSLLLSFCFFVLSLIFHSLYRLRSLLVFFFLFFSNKAALFFVLDRSNSHA